MGAGVFDRAGGEARWLVAFCFTDDRRMFFPYTMQYAV
jgi:hypothetical protein